MTDQGLAAEIREIEAQLEKLKRSQGIDDAAVTENKAKEDPQPDSDIDIEVEELDAVRSLLDEFDAESVMDSLSTHAGEWLAVLNEDLKQTKPSTLLTVFGLGVIVGRLTK